MNHLNENQQTPLSTAAKYGDADVVRLLIGTGQAELDTRCSWTDTRASGEARAPVEYRTPLVWATVSLDEDIFEQLLNAGADPDAQGCKDPEFASRLIATLGKAVGDTLRGRTRMRGRGSGCLRY